MVVFLKTSKRAKKYKLRVALWNLASLPVHGHSARLQVLLGSYQEFVENREKHHSMASMKGFQHLISVKKALNHSWYLPIFQSFPGLSGASSQTKGKGKNSQGVTPRFSRQPVVFSHRSNSLTVDHPTAASSWAASWAKAAAFSSKRARTASTPEATTLQLLPTMVKSVIQINVEKPIQILKRVY